MLHSYSKCVINLLDSMLAQRRLPCLLLSQFQQTISKENELPVGIETMSRAMVQARGGRCGTDQEA